ncbi:MAG: Bifunctional phosphoglucose/phosphomannose isomerase [candidate division TM6 bacterium GW2011_GWF2_37_49]|nr:MAG: Bifunctional phosphoglucose/phosphomannose isomerase [candidate division TM6 bacterium GW2011_GWF2_37_49]
MMIKEFLLWSQKLRNGFQLAQDFYTSHSGRILKSPKKIAFVGMGGSGIAGRIIKTFLDSKEGITCFVVDSTKLPAYIDSSTLVFVVSYSGNTWESLDVLNQLAEKFVPTVVLAHGGKAIEIAEAKNLPFVIMPSSVTPRSALGDTLGFFLGLFDKMAIMDGKHKLDAFVKHAELYIPKFAEPAYFKDFLNIVEGFDFFHVWGVSGDTDAFAYRAQTQFNENSKVHSVYSAFPELNHNLINGFAACKERPCVLFFHSEFLPLNLSMAVEATCEILREYDVVLYKPPVLGNTFESQLFNVILWSDFASYYLGKARGVSVEDVKLIESLKSKQKQKGLK